MVKVVTLKCRIVIVTTRLSVAFSPHSIESLFITRANSKSARSGTSNWIHLPLRLYKLCALYISWSVSSCHPKTNKLLGTSLLAF